MAKKVQFIASREEAARQVLEASFNRTHEERIRWLYRQVAIMQEFNPSIHKPSGYALKKSNG